jgi:putative phosphoesterase
MLSAAVTAGNEHGCGALLHAGDFISPPGIQVLAEFAGDIHIVWGNCDGEKVGMLRRLGELPRATHHGDVMECEIGGLRFYMNHYPGIAENAALSGKYDVVVFGHTHEYHEDHTANGTILLNPGEIQGYRTGTSSVSIFDTESRHVTRIDLTPSHS